MNAVDVVLLVGGIAMVLYAVLGGADFGGGVWDLLASGPRAAGQRDAVAAAIGPVWEANHVWLIYILVLSFTCFPQAYADVTVGLYAPMSIALLGIVLRGTAFVFRNFATNASSVTRGLSLVFGIASLVTPFAFGDCIGALATGHYGTLSPFALAVGLFAVAVCAQTAAVFILVEIGDKALRDDFRQRAIRSTIVVWVAGLLPLVASRKLDPTAFASFHRLFAVIAIVVTLAAGAGVIVCVRQRSDGLARVFVVVETASIFGGWFGAQAPQLIPGRYTFIEASASDSMIAAFLNATALGSVILVPSLLLLFSVFKSEKARRLGPPGEIR